MSAVVITMEQLQLAYRQLSRPGWPPLEQCLQDHVRRTCLEGIARNMGRPAWRPAIVAGGLPQGLPIPADPEPPAKAPAKVSPITSYWSRPRPVVDPRKRLVDLKRAAANDRDD